MVCSHEFLNSIMTFQRTRVFAMAMSYPTIMKLNKFNVHRGHELHSHPYFESSLLKI